MPGFFEDVGAAFSALYRAARQLPPPRKGFLSQPLFDDVGFLTYFPCDYIDDYLYSKAGMAAENVLIVIAMSLLTDEQRNALLLDEFSYAAKKHASSPMPLSRAKYSLYEISVV